MSATLESGTRDTLSQLCQDRILVIDGAMGALIFENRPDEAGYRGEQFKNHPVDLRNCNDLLVLTQPKLIEDIHRQYLEAGADIIETNTFNANPVSLKEFQVQEHTREINRRAAALARSVAESFTKKNPDRPRFVAGSIGPSNVMLSMSQNADDPAHRTHSFEQMVDAYYEQVAGLVEGGVDILLPETSFDTLTMKSCLFAISKYFAEHNVQIPVMISGTIFEGGRTLSAQSVEAFYTSVSHFDMFSIGLNCSLGPVQMRPYVEELSRQANCAISCYPNAGMPDGMGGFDANPTVVPRTAGSILGAAAVAPRRSTSTRSPSPSATSNRGAGHSGTRSPSTAGWKRSNCGPIPTSSWWASGRT